jgi:hypothetical protein
VALVGGGVVGMAMMGVIDIPGLSPAKKKIAAAGQYAGDKESKQADAAGAYSGDKDGKAAATVEVAPPKKAPPAKPKAAKPLFVIDPVVGRKKVAKLWNEMSVDSLQKMIGSFKGPDLPRILAIMDAGKVAKLLEKLDPAKAAKLSKDIQAEASKVKAPA